MVTKGPKHVASHTINYDVLDISCFIILILDKICSVWSYGVSLPSYSTLNTQMLTGLTQCTSKWESFQKFGSNSVLLLNS